MQIQLTGRHVEITEALKNFVNTKFEKLARHAHQIAQIHVILSTEKNQHSAEVTVHVSGHDLFAQSSADNMYAAIDVLLDKIDRQLLKHKGKIQSR